MRIFYHQATFRYMFQDFVMPPASKNVGRSVIMIVLDGQLY